jgi:UDP-2-acetamido-2-deoxy-ribo-hexuluronate aminotransferase
VIWDGLWEVDEKIPLIGYFLMKGVEIIMIKYFDNKFEYLTIKRNAFKELDNAVLKGRFMSSDYKDRLQNILSNFTGSKYCILTKSGTQALAVALKCLGIKEGDLVATTAYTFIATLSAIRLVGAKPVIIDIDKNTWNIDVNKLEEELKTNKSIKCILPVDIFGNPCDYDSILDLGKKYNIPVLEDACQSFTAEYHGKKTCNVGCDMSAVSFYPTKPFGGFGEGGALFTNDEDLYKKSCSLLNHGSNGDNNCIVDGTNGEVDSLHVIMMLERARTIDTILKKRNEIADCYKQLKGVAFQEVESNSISAWCRIQVEGENETIQLLKNYFETDSLYSNTIWDNKLYLNTSNSVANRIAHHSISLPIYNSMDINALNESILEYNKNF